jgi:transposase
VIPTKSDQRRQAHFDRTAYRGRNQVERSVGRLKQFRRVATRYDKRACNYLALGHPGRHPHLAMTLCGQALVLQP